MAGLEEINLNLDWQVMARSGSIRQLHRLAAMADFLSVELSAKPADRFRLAAIDCG